ncbi:DUF2849 domain-containing protein [Rhodobacteraceae bacterium DSL-40]|uniref:DUF2849 domain-containing protein n=1 Tax=Amaricoccus sp. B4 TaxID=3368557 RepID=UPI000DAC0CB0
MAKVFAPQIATGNDLLEGDVVYFTAAGGWTRVLAEAATAGSREEADALLARASKFPNEVVGVYLTDMALDAEGRPVPVHFREEFRLKGPSNRPEHARAAATQA